MGFFDRFGAGGGTLEIRPEAAQLAPGQVLQGYVVFHGGKRAQKITNITIKLALSTTEQVKGPQGVQSQHHVRDVCPNVLVSGAFETVPGQQHPFPFQLQLPQGLPGSQPGHQDYRLSAAADIDGEVDPGAGLDVTIVAPGGVAHPAGATPAKAAAVHTDEGLHADKGAVGGVHHDKGAVAAHHDKGAVAAHHDKGAVAAHHDKGAVATPPDKFKK